MSSIVIDPDETDRLELTSDARLPTAAPDYHATQSDLTPSFMRTFLLSAKRENLTVTGIEKADEILERDYVGEQLDPSFNPYAYIEKLWEPELKEEFRDEIARGLFDGMASAYQVEMRLEELKRRRGEMEIIEGGSGTAMFLGALTGALTDPVSYTPIGWVNRIRFGGRIGRMAAAGAASAVVPEVGLQMAQDYRTFEESMLNLGFGAVLGGGIGAFSKLLSKGHPAGVGGQVFDPNMTEGLAIRHNDGSVDVVLDPVGIGGDAGAAAVKRGAPVQTPLKGMFTWLPGVKTAQRVTPLGRMIHSPIAFWRGEGMRFADTGGILTDQMRAGHTVISAEDYKRGIISQTLDQVFSHAQITIRKMQKDLGVSGLSVRTTVGNPVPDGKVMEIVQQKLTKTLNDEHIALYRQEYGEAWPRVEKAVDDITANVHKTNKFVEDNLIEHGIIRSDERVATYEAEVEKLKVELAVAKEQAAAARAPGAAADVAVHAQRGELEIEGALKDAETLLSNERLKPEPMGEDYGHAQMYDSKSVRDDPEGFKNWLREVLKDKPTAEYLDRIGLSEAEFNKLGTEPVEINGEQLTKAQGKALRETVLEDWGGSEQVFKLDVAEGKLLSARQAHDAAVIDKKGAEADFRQATRELAKADESRIKSTRDLINNRMETARQRTETARREVKAVQRELDALEATGKASKVESGEEAKGLQARLEELAKEKPRGRDTHKSKRTEIEGSVSRLEAELADLVSQKVNNTGKPLKGLASATKAKRISLKALKSKLTGLSAPEGRTAKEIADEVAETQAKLNKVGTERQQGSAVARMRDAKAELTRAQANETRTAARADLLEARASDLEERRAQLVEAKREYKDANTAAAKAERKARKARKTIEGNIRGLQLRGQGPLPDLNAVTTDIQQNISNTSLLPHGILDQIVPDTGRFKARQLHLTPEQRVEGQNAGFLRKDLAQILHAQYDQVGSHLGYRMGLGIGDFAGARFGSWDEYRKHLEDGIQAEVTRVQASGGSARQLAKLRKERVSILKDAVGMKDRLLGTEHRGDPDAWLPWLSQKVRDANYIRIGSGFLVSSLNDVAAAGMVNGGLAKLVANHMPEAVRLMRSLHDDSLSDFKMFLYSFEQGPSANRTQRLAGSAEDHTYQMGRGQRGLLPHGFTSKTDKALMHLKNMTGTVSGLNYWNRGWKIMTGLNWAHKLDELVPKLVDGKLDERMVGDLASLGVGVKEAKLLNEFLSKHRVKGADGSFDPQFELWTGKRGQEAEQLFRMAIRRAADRANFSPGIADTPLLMSHPLGAMWLQFQTFAFAFTNRFMSPISQKFVNGQHAEAVAAMAHLAYASAIVVAGKQILRGESDDDIVSAWTDPDKLAGTMYDVLDRTGYLAFLSPYIDSTLKMTGDIQEQAFGAKLKPGSRFAALNAWQSLLGPGFGLGKDTAALIQSGLAGDSEKIGKHLMRVAPFRVIWQGGAAVHQRID